MNIFLSKLLHWVEFMKFITLSGVLKIVLFSFIKHIGITKCQLYSIFSYKLFFDIQLKLKERDRFIKHIGMTK